MKIISGFLDFLFFPKILAVLIWTSCWITNWFLLVIYFLALTCSTAILVYFKLFTSSNLILCTFPCDRNGLDFIGVGIESSEKRGRTRVKGLPNYIIKVYTWLTECIFIFHLHPFILVKLWDIPWRFLLAE